MCSREQEVRAVSAGIAAAERSNCLSDCDQMACGYGHYFKNVAECSDTLLQLCARAVSCIYRELIMYFCCNSDFSPNDFTFVTYSCVSV